MLKSSFTQNMLFSKEYVGYLAREVAKKLVASGLIETKAVPALNEKVHAALLASFSKLIPTKCKRRARTIRKCSAK